MPDPVFKRILLKISGEALAADQGFGVGKFSRDFMNAGSVDAEALIGGQGFAGDF